MSAVHATHESKLPYYGAVGGRLVAAQKGLYEIAEVLEKPTPTEAEQRLIVPGLRAGHYLCFFGMHALTPAVMELLAEDVARAGDRVTHLTTALAKLAKRERYLACELQGRRYDIGVKYGLLMAQLALALDGKERDEVLSGLVELLARRPAEGAAAYDELRGITLQQEAQLVARPQPWLRLARSRPGTLVFALPEEIQRPLDASLAGQERVLVVGMRHPGLRWIAD